MTTEEKLKIFREKIQSSPAFNNNFRQLIGIELFDFIQADDTIKSEFNRRLNYLKNLAEDKDFNILQDNLFQVIQKILKLTSLSQVQLKQKEWNNALGNRLKTRSLFNKDDKKEKIFLTLPELYVALQNKNNYYRLGDSSYFSPTEGEISTFTHVIPVRKQYEANVEKFFRLIFSNKFIYDEKDARLDKLIDEYNDYWYKFDELIYRIPIQLHFHNFEEFFLDCVKFHPRQGYAWFYSFFSSSEPHTENKFEKIKENSIVVIDDLVATLEEGVVLQQPKTKRSGSKLIEIKYDEDTSTLKIGGQICPIPPYKNEYYLCLAMYKHKINEPVDWSEIYESMTGYYEEFYGKPPKIRASWRVVYDAMEALNKRVKEMANIDDELFVWQEKTIRRNY